MDGQNWREYTYEGAFRECCDADAWVGSGDSEILVCYYTIEEDVPRLTDLDGSERKMRGAQPLSGSATACLTAAARSACSAPRKTTARGATN